MLAEIDGQDRQAGDRMREGGDVGGRPAPNPVQQRANPKPVDQLIGDLTELRRLY